MCCGRLVRRVWLGGLPVAWRSQLMRSAPKQKLTAQLLFQLHMCPVHCINVVHYTQVLHVGSSAAFGSISEAVAAAPDGATIRVSPGMCVALSALQHLVRPHRGQLHSDQLRVARLVCPECGLEAAVCRFSAGTASGCC